MEFRKFAEKVNEHFQNMMKTSTVMFEVDSDKETIWGTYLESFPDGTNEIYITNTEHDCSACRHFIKQFGGVVVIKDGNMESIWDIDIDGKYGVVAKALSDYVHSLPVRDVHLEKDPVVGTMKTVGTNFFHFFAEIPRGVRLNTSRSVADIQGEYRDSKNVFRRSLEEIYLESLDTVLDLIASNTLYKGNEWEHALKDFRKLKIAYDKLTTDADKDLFAWEKSVSVGRAISRIRNHSIGVLLVNISEGMELDNAVRQYEVIVAPANYKRPKAIFTKKMLEEAQKTIEELGYMDSLARRYAVLDDITVNNVLFSDKDSAKRIGGTKSVFDDMMKDATKKPKKFSKVEEISAEEFVDKVLPRCTSVEAYFENKHASNMVSLIAPSVSDSKTMFKWNNNFSWAYSGNMTDSMMKERVKNAGGDVTGDLRFSIQWNDIDTGSDQNDLDAHCKLPDGLEIFYGQKHVGTGKLDVDIINPNNKVAVENITFPDRNRMRNGTYKFFVHQFSNRGGRDGFRAEIEFDGRIYSFDYRNELRQDEDVQVAEVTLKDGQFAIKEKLPSAESSREIWGIKTNDFVPVSVICYSPNYWDEQKGIGNKHIFFMLKDCINPESPNGFFNEFLKEDLMKHKRVFEALGGKMKVEDSDDQLSGIGFCMTKRGELIVRVKGSVERVMKIKF